MNCPPVACGHAVKNSRIIAAVASGFWSIGKWPVAITCDHFPPRRSAKRRWSPGESCWSRVVTRKPRRPDHTWSPVFCLYRSKDSGVNSATMRSTTSLLRPVPRPRRMAVAGGRVPASRIAVAMAHRFGAGIADTKDPPAAGITAAIPRKPVTRSGTSRQLRHRPHHLRSAPRWRTGLAVPLRRRVRHMRPAEHRSSLRAGAQLPNRHSPELAHLSKSRARGQRR